MRGKEPVEFIGQLVAITVMACTCIVAIAITIRLARWILGA